MSLPGAEQRAANSTADAARVLGEAGSADEAAIAPRLAAERYGLAILAEDVEDHPDNQTRFVLVARTLIPKPTGHDKTSIVCFQRADHPGSLHGILGQFAARNINLTKLESRPTKQGLGDYCFVIDLSGHLGDEVVADCLRDLHAGLAGVKFLGSYPAAGEHGPEQRRQADAAWQAADEWLRRVAPIYRLTGVAEWAREPGRRRAITSAMTADDRSHRESDEDTAGNRPRAPRDRGHGSTSDADAEGDAEDVGEVQRGRGPTLAPGRSGSEHHQRVGA